VLQGEVLVLKLLAVDGLATGAAVMSEITALQHELQAMDAAQVLCSAQVRHESVQLERV